MTALANIYNFCLDIFNGVATLPENQAKIQVSQLVSKNEPDDLKMISNYLVNELPTRIQSIQKIFIASFKDVFLDNAFTIKDVPIILTMIQTIAAEMNEIANKDAIVEMTKASVLTFIRTIFIITTEMFLSEDHFIVVHDIIQSATRLLGTDILPFVAPKKSHCCIF
jgi:hypothetical protein